MCMYGSNTLLIISTAFEAFVGELNVILTKATLVKSGNKTHSRKLVK